MGTDGRAWNVNLSYDKWESLPVDGPRPSARYKHAAAFVDEKLYITGGSRNGRYLSDIQVLDLRNLSWSTLKPKTEPTNEDSKGNNLMEVFPAMSGHSMIRWENKLLLAAGQSKAIADTVTVRFMDVESHVSGIMQTTGNIPVARAGQSLSLIGSKLIMFGGEDRRRRLLNDVHVLDLETMAWNAVETFQTPPAPRFDHTAAVHACRYLLIFGGCSHSVFFDDLHVLDLETMEWSQPEILGDIVSPRAGHAGISIDEDWFIVGGGDNKTGASETLVLDMSRLVFSTLTNVMHRDPLASEGLTVSSVLLDNQKFLVAFGGYNGKYQNEVFVMKPKPKNSKQPKIFQSPAAAAAAASVTAAYALAKSENLDFPATEDSKPKIDLSLEITAIKEEKRVLESSVSEVKSENSSLKVKLDEANSTHSELLKELHSVQSQLAAERSRCANLEAQITEIQKMLVSMQSIEEEVLTLRRQKSALEHNMELSASVQKQGSGGVLRWIAG